MSPKNNAMISGSLFLVAIVGLVGLALNHIPKQSDLLPITCAAGTELRTSYRTVDNPQQQCFDKETEVAHGLYSGLYFPYRLTGRYDQGKRVGLWTLARLETDPGVEMEIDYTDDKPTEMRRLFVGKVWERTIFTQSIRLNGLEKPFFATVYNYDAQTLQPSLVRTYRNGEIAEIKKLGNPSGS